MDVLAWNSMAAALVIDFATVRPKHRNLAWLAFAEPSVRALYPQWENVGHMCVAQLRREAARDPEDPEDPELAALVASSRSATRTSAAGGARTTSRPAASGPSSTATPSPATSPSTGTP